MTKHSNSISCDTNDCSIGRIYDIRKNMNKNNKYGICLKHQQQHATQQHATQQYHSKPSITLVQQEHPQLNYPPYNTSKNIKMTKKNNDFINVAMTIYSIYLYI